jgi:CHAT domain
MPIPSDDLEKQFIIATPDATVADLLARLPTDRNQRVFSYVVLPGADGRYIVVRWLEVEQIAAGIGQQALDQLFANLPGLPKPVVGVEQQSMGLRAARDLRDEQPGKRLVVLANGAVVGLLVLKTLHAEDMQPDPFIMSRDLPMPSPGVLSADDILPPSSIPKGAEPPPATAPVDDRVINAWVDGLAHNEPLELEKTYDLKFNVAPPQANAATAAFDAKKFFSALPPNVKQAELLVALETDDFTIYGDDQQTLIVPREGKSKNTVTFSIEPKKNGAGVIKALFIANNRVFQKMTITLQVGPVAADKPIVDLQSTGLTMGSALAQMTSPAQHNISLTIIKQTASYQFRIQNGGLMRATLNLSEPQIADLIAYARDALKSIVYTLVNNSYVYQIDSTTIPDDVHAATLKALARLGYYLYQKVFYSPGNGPDAQAMGAFLRQLSQQEQLRIQIVAERFIFPWALLYDRDPLDLNNVDPQGFWGFKHIVEYLPEFSSVTPVNFNPQIAVADKLGIGFVFNTTIDTQLKRPIVESQRSFLQALPGVSVTEHPNCQDLYDLLNNTDSPIQLLYFYCHAESGLPGETGGVAGSKVILSDGTVQLMDLDIFAPTNRPPLKQAPLVFLNACQSAELSPYLYDGLVPYLVAKGARGVLGTEVNTPALFAAEFAQEFLKRFVAGGKSLGEILLDLRCEYLTQKHNVMGLVYALYSSGDVIIQRAS